jgi:Fe2+ transport system protein B
VQGYEDRVQKLTEMLDDPDLSKREKLAVIRTLNETGRQLLALRDKRKEKKSGEETEEGRHARIAMQIEQMRKNGEEYQRKQKIKFREEFKDELRQEIMEELESEIA